MTGFEMAVGAVGQEASRIRTHAEEYHAALDPLRARGDGVSSFGDDGIFGMFVMMYAECRAVAMDVRDGLSMVMDETGEGLYAASRNTREGEAANAEPMTNLGRAWS